MFSAQTRTLTNHYKNREIQELDQKNKKTKQSTSSTPFHFHTIFEKVHSMGALKPRTLYFNAHMSDPTVSLSSCSLANANPCHLSSFSQLKRRNWGKFCLAPPVSIYFLRNPLHRLFLHIPSHMNTQMKRCVVNNW